MSRIPYAPSGVTLSNITQTSVDAIFTENDNGGEPVIETQIGYGTDSSIPQMFESFNPVTISGLNPEFTYYFWDRVRNVNGWSPWSMSTSVRLVAGAYVKIDNIWKRALPYVNVNGTWMLAQPWARRLGVWKQTT